MRFLPGILLGILRLETVGSQMRLETVGSQRHSTRAAGDKNAFFKGFTGDFDGFSTCWDGHMDFPESPRSKGGVKQGTLGLPRKSKVQGGCGRGSSGASEQKCVFFQGLCFQRL